MGEQDEQANVRRLGRKDRKRRLDPRGPLFPVEEPLPAPPAPEPVEAEPDFAPSVEEKSTVSKSSAPAAGRFPSLDFDSHDESPPSPAPAPVHSRSTCLPNLITLIFLFATVAAIAVFAIITANPYTALNPFPPFTPLPVIVTATFLPPTATLPGPTATFTPIPLDASGNPFTFILARNTPLYIANANDQACNWSSIAGTVTDASGAALDGYGVHVKGEGVDSVVFSGAALTFGSGGFELFLNGTALEKTYSVELLSPEGVVVSQAYSVTTQANCDQNVAVLAFMES